jgi:hypothetical protein
LNTDSKEQVVVVPSTIDGKTVAEINKFAFNGNTNLEAVVLPDTVQVIDDGAFTGCKNLKYVFIPEGVKTIGSDAFNGNGIMELTLPASIEDVADGLAINGLTKGCKVNLAPGFNADLKASLDEMASVIGVTVVQQ